MTIKAIITPKNIFKLNLTKYATIVKIIIRIIKIAINDNIFIPLLFLFFVFLYVYLSFLHKSIFLS